MTNLKEKEGRCPYVVPLIHIIRLDDEFMQDAPRVSNPKGNMDLEVPMDNDPSGED